MAKQIIDDTVMENVEILAKLALTEEERKKAKEKMQEMSWIPMELNLCPIHFLWEMYFVKM